MTDWIMSAVVAILISGAVTGILGAFISGMISDSQKAQSLLIKIMVTIGIIGAIALTFVMNGSSSNSSRNSYGSSTSSHSCCICGKKASYTYGNDYWCSSHYYMAKTADGDLSP